MDHESRFPPILSSSLCQHRAPARRLPARVVRRWHGPGRPARRAGRFVQLRKELSTEETSIFACVFLLEIRVRRHIFASILLPRRLGGEGPIRPGWPRQAETKLCEFGFPGRSWRIEAQAAPSPQLEHLHDLKSQIVFYRVRAV